MSKKKTIKPNLHKDLEGFTISVNQFGEIKSSFPIEKLNVFLNEKVEDKKIKNRFSKKKPKKED